MSSENPTYTIPPPSGLLAISWAKFDRETEDWMPLHRHLEDVAAMAEQLWDNWIPTAVKKSIADAFGGPDLARKIYVFVAAGHDVGKHSTAFIEKAPQLQTRMATHGAEFISIPEENAKNNPHGLYSGLSLIDWAASRNAAGNSRFTDRLAAVIAGHHGIFPSLRLPIEGCHYLVEKEKHWHKERLELWDRARSLAGLTDQEFVELSTLIPSPPALVLLNGALIIADWLGSNTYYFPFRDPRSSQERAATALQRLRFPSRWCPESDIDIDELFQNRFNFPPGASPRPVQLRAAQLASEVDASPFFIIEAPTGEGKTEAAMAAAEVLAKRFGKQGVIFALPTCATSDGMFGRVLSWLDTALPSGTKTSAVLSHGKSQFNEDYEELISQNEDGFHEVYDESEEQKVEAHWWFRGNKTSSLSSFSIGTIDQVLFAALKAKHFSLRHFGLAEKVVILDEIHAADEYMSVYLNRVLEWLGALGVPVIALSATLPASKRRQLVEAYLLGVASQGHMKKSEVRRVTAELMTSAGYPLITVANRNEVAAHPCERSGRTFEIQVKSIGDDIDYRITAILDAYHSGGCVAVIHNTVARAQETYELLRGLVPADDLVLLHSRFLAFDRRTRERDLLKRLGPDEVEGRRPQIVVATQVIEQSLDIDFDLMFSDWAPLDLILQRAGRLHRHQSHDCSRPASLVDPTVVLMGSNIEAVEKIRDSSAPQFNKGSEFVYSRSLLLRTASALGRHMQSECRPIKVPDDVENLMREVYEETECYPDQWSEDWIVAEKQRRDQVRSKIEKAQVFLLPTPKEAQFSKYVITEVSTDEAQARAQVRDAEDTIEVIVIQKLGGVLQAVPWLPIYGGFPVDSTIGIDEDVAKAVARCTVSLPAWTSAGNLGDQLIGDLEKNGIASWQHSQWLKRQLPLVLDENLRATVGAMHFEYSPEVGMKVGID